MNVSNNGTLIGYLTKEPVFFDNKDGSKKVMLTIAVKDNFKTGGERLTNFIPVEGFIQKGKTNTAYDYLHKGSHVGLSTQMKSSQYKDSNGNMQYKTYVAIQGVDLMDNKERTAELKIKAKNEAAEANTAETVTGAPVTEVIAEADAPFK